MFPNLQKYLNIEEPDSMLNAEKLLVIGKVDKDRFPGDIHSPIFSVRHFMINRIFNVCYYFYYYI